MSAFRCLHIYETGSQCGLPYGHDGFHEMADDVVDTLRADLSTATAELQAAREEIERLRFIQGESLSSTEALAVGRQVQALRSERDAALKRAEEEFDLGSGYHRRWVRETDRADALSAEVDRLTEHDADTQTLLVAMTKLKDEGWAEVTRLRAALRKYGQHTVRNAFGFHNCANGCTCGLNAALAASTTAERGGT